jgi:hypothetical protein
MGDVREGRITTVIKTDYQLDLPKTSKSWSFGGLSLSFTPRFTADGYEAVRDYSVTRTWLTAEEKMALDRASGEINAYDRLSIRVAEKKILTWLPSFLVRVAIWGALPLAAGVAWLIASLVR